MFLEKTVECPIAHFRSWLAEVGWDCISKSCRRLKFNKDTNIYTS